MGSICSWSIFFKDWQDWFDHSRSFSKINKSESIPSIFKKDWRGKIDKSDLIIVDLFKRLTKVIWSWSIFFKDQKDQKIKDRKIERSNSQPWEDFRISKNNKASINCSFLGWSDFLVQMATVPNCFRTHSKIAIYIMRFLTH